MKELLPSEKFLITKTLSDGEDDLGVRCKVFDKELNDVTPLGTYLNLTHIFGGMYGYVHTVGFPSGMYVVVFETYETNSYSDLSQKYGIIEENIRVKDIVTEVLAGIPDNILLDNDSRLDNLNTIPNLALEASLGTVETNITNSLEDIIDDSDGRAT